MARNRACEVPLGTALASSGISSGVRRSDHPNVTPWLALMLALQPWYNFVEECLEAVGPGEVEEAQLKVPHAQPDELFQLAGYHICRAAYHVDALALFGLRWVIDQADECIVGMEYLGGVTAHVAAVLRQDALLVGVFFGGAEMMVPPVGVPGDHA